MNRKYIWYIANYARGKSPEISYEIDDSNGVYLSRDVTGHNEWFKSLQAAKRFVRIECALATCPKYKWKMRTVPCE